MNSQVTRFFRESGLKLLAIADLSATEYSTLLYLLNSAMSGLDSLIANETELASIVGHPSADVRSAIEMLTRRGFIKSHYGDGTQAPKLQSVSLAINWDIAKWRLKDDEPVLGHSNHHEAVIFQFRRTGAPQLQILDGQRHGAMTTDRPVIHKPASELEAWHRIYESFSRGRDLDDHETKTTQVVAKALSEAHPVDQILVIVRHFGTRIPTLSLLASNWDHYLELYEQEHQKLDLFEIRQKQNELDQKARESALATLERRAELSLSDEEVHVLRLLSEHRHPRRQLFWAYQQRIRYPKLASFFIENQSLMLPITHSGQVVKSPLDT